MKWNNNGFTLVELVAVITILAIIAISVSSRFTSTSSFSLQAARDDTVAGLFYAQQAALARGNSVTIKFESTGSQISVLEGGSPIGQYPITLANGASLETVELTYDKLGRTSATELTLSSGGSDITITITASGYAY